MNHVFSVIMQFPHKFRLARVIRTRGGKEGVVPVAVEIFGTHLRHIQNFRAMIPFFLNICFTIDKVKRETIGQTSPTDISNSVQTVIGHEILKQTSWTESDLRWLEQVTNVFTAQNDFLTSWGKAKLWTLKNAMEHVFSTREFVNQSYILDGSSIEDLELAYESNETHIKETMERLVELRKYGVKSSFTQNGFVQNSSQAWVMWDYRDFEGHLGISRRKNLIASVALAQQSSQIKSLKLEEVKKEGIDYAGVGVTFPVSFLWMLGVDGELEVSSTGLNTLPVREVFEQADKRLLYQVIRMKLMYHLYDLVVPVEKLATLPQIPHLKQGALAKIQRALGFLKKDPVVDMVLPRVLLLEKRAELFESAERELQQSAEETQKRSVRQHDVVDFIRPLPKGHKPSAMARKRAFEAFGIELKDNETFVRSHRRGGGEEITAHRTKKRP